jgi:hypothetical protein
MMITTASAFHAYRHAGAAKPDNKHDNIARPLVLDPRCGLTD